MNIRNIFFFSFSSKEENNRHHPKKIILFNILHLWIHSVNFSLFLLKIKNNCTFLEIPSFRSTFFFTTKGFWVSEWPLCYFSCKSISLFISYDFQTRVDLYNSLGSSSRISSGWRQYLRCHIFKFFLLKYCAFERSKLTASTNLFSFMILMTSCNNL